VPELEETGAGIDNDHPRILPDRNCAAMRRRPGVATYAELKTVSGFRMGLKVEEEPADRPVRPSIQGAPLHSVTRTVAGQRNLDLVGDRALWKRDADGDRLCTAMRAP
jgi:hypothetical protein